MGTRWCPVLTCDPEQLGCVIDQDSGQRLAPDDDGSVEQDVLDSLKGEGSERSPLCEGPGFATEGCGCRSTGEDRRGAWWLLLLMLVRRRARAPLSRRARSARGALG